VTATGAAPLAYQWYEGQPGDTSRPVGTDADSFTTPALSSITTYWVRVSNGCGEADSEAATLSVGTMDIVWIPVVTHGSGLKGSQWRSDLGLLNPGAARADVQVEFFGDDGVASSTRYVSPGVQSTLTDVVEQLGASASGALEPVSNQPLKVTSRTYNQVSSAAACNPGGTQGQEYPALSTDDGLTLGQSAYLPGLVETADSFRCNIGLVNTGTTSATVLVELHDGAATKLTRYTVTLEAGQWAQETQPFKKKAGQTAMQRGYARITVQSGSGAFGFASVIDNITNDPTTIPM
jgi:hypothetical protein